MVNAAASQRASGFAKTPWAAESPRFQAGGSQMRGSQAVRAAPARQRLKLEAFFLHRDPFEPLMSETWGHAAGEEHLGWVVERPGAWL